MVGTTIGSYRVTSMLGQGGMGAIYAAQHTLLGKPVAIKLLLPGMSQRPDFVTRFFNEARAATAIRHPGIVDVYDLGWTDEGTAYIVMELLQGESLSDRLGRGRLDWRVALRMARQIANTLSAVHSKGIVHRDLKPSNIFVVPDLEIPSGERLKLLDFGIAKLALENVSQAQTPEGIILGTPRYMAPEQCRGTTVDHRADLYALGCIVFRMCAGRPPFTKKASGDLLAAHVYIPPPRIRTLAPGVSLSVELLLQDLLAKDPADRLQTADEVIQRIDLATSTPPALSLTGHETIPLLRELSGSAQSHVTDILSMTRATADLPNLPVASPPGDDPRKDDTLATNGVSAGVLAGHGPRSRTAAKTRPGLSIAAVMLIATATTAAVQRWRATRDDPDTMSSEPPSAGSSSLGPEDARPRVPAPGPSITSAAPPGTSLPRSLQAPVPPPSPRSIDAEADGMIAVVIDSSPAGAEVVLDAVVLGRTPYRGAVAKRDPRITFLIRLNGYEERRATVATSKPIQLSVKLASPSRRKSRLPVKDQSVNPFVPRRSS